MITSTHFFATAGATARSATPVLVDIEPVTFNLDPVASAPPSRIDKVIPRHLYACANGIRFSRLPPARPSGG